MHAAPFPEAQSTGSSAMVQSWPSCRHSNLLSSSALNFNFTKSEGTLTTHLATSSLQQRSFNFLSWGTATNRRKTLHVVAPVWTFSEIPVRPMGREANLKGKNAHTGGTKLRMNCVLAPFSTLSFKSAPRITCFAFFPSELSKKCHVHVLPQASA